MIEFDEKTAKALMNLHDCIKAAVFDIISSQEKKDDEVEAVVSQMFGACLWAMLNKGEDRDKVLGRMLEDYKARQ